MAQAKRVRVYLVDDQAIIRAALRGSLGSRPEFEVVGDSGEPRAALAEIERLRPDVVILDLTMPGLSGLDLLPVIRRQLPGTRVVMLSHDEEESFLEKALKGGAEGVLSKDSDPAELAQALLAPQRGEPCVPPRVDGGLLRGQGNGSPRPATAQLAELTVRERQVFQLLALGRSDEEVATALDISLGTARKHREVMRRKLGCRSAAQLARLARRAKPL